MIRTVRYRIIALLIIPIFALLNSIYIYFNYVHIGVNSVIFVSIDIVLYSVFAALILPLIRKSITKSKYKPRFFDVSYSAVLITTHISIYACTRTSFIAIPSLSFLVSTLLFVHENPLCTFEGSNIKKAMYHVLHLAANISMFLILSIAAYIILLQLWV